MDLKFLTGPKAILKLKKDAMKLKRSRVLRIIGLGMSGFTMSITNSSVQVMYNAMLQKTGGDLYVGIMTVINTVREVISMPVQGITHSSQPVMGYNYGAKEYGRVKRLLCLYLPYLFYIPLECGLSSIHSLVSLSVFLTATVTW